MNRAALKILQFLLGFAFLLAFSETLLAGHYRFWLHGKIRFPYSVATGDTTGGSDCWGWTAPDGTEYALMGVRDGIAVVNAHTMQVKAVVPGPETPASYYWRDVETYRHYAYAVSELTGTNQGLSVIDLQYLPDSVHFVGSFPLNLSGAVTAHTIAIDTLKGFAYCERSGATGQPIVILSLANPEAPTFVGSFGPLGGQSIHDMFARNDTVFVAEGWDSLAQGSWSVWNCANKAAPTQITRVIFPGAGYVHSAWATEDRNFLLTTEEIPAGKTMKVWDIADLGNIDLRGQYIGAAQIPHNVYPKGNLVFVSHYEAGVTVVDISNPDTLVEVARYDTYPASDLSNYRGCWSAYPYTGNNFVYASNLDGWLFVLRFGQVGDLNFDSLLSPADIVLALNCIFAGSGDCPLEILDANCDASVTPADLVLILNAVFNAQPLPC
ncbi:MAG: choice-of-anchor B family protein [candidate division Zixibacteria bacterium]|nr:choice-of-anchor B family protein [candidate division Zixibacteria bacterium]